MRALVGSNGQFVQNVSESCDVLRDACRTRVGHNRYHHSFGVQSVDESSKEGPLFPAAINNIKGETTAPVREMGEEKLPWVGIFIVFFTILYHHWLPTSWSSVLSDRQDHLVSTAVVRTPDE